MHQYYFCNLSYKRYFRIDQHLAWHFVHYVECLSSPTLFLCGQIITPFLNSMISSNQEKGLAFLPIVKPLSCSNVGFLLYIYNIYIYYIYRRLTEGFMMMSCKWISILISLHIVNRSFMVYHM